MTMQMIAYKATKTPCCMDTLMPNVCKSLYNRDHEKFTKQCRTNPDFSFIQCCHSCHFNMDMFTSDSKLQFAELSAVLQWFQLSQCLLIFTNTTSKNSSSAIIHKTVSIVTELNSVKPSLPDQGCGEENH